MAMSACDALHVTFDAVSEEYEKARPTYPPDVYDALEPLTDALVLEGGAGTGIATAALLQRGARVVAFDVSDSMIRRATRRLLRLPVVIADGAFLPFRAECADLLCFAQAWHWVDSNRRCSEAARILRSGGRWAGWWSHARADGEEWFDAYWDSVEVACPGVTRNQRDVDWGEDVHRSGFFSVDRRITIEWLRRVRVEVWLIEERSRNYIAALSKPDRDNLLRDIERIVLMGYPEGEMTVRYETWLWVAHKH